MEKEILSDGSRGSKVAQRVFERRQSAVGISPGRSPNSLSHKDRISHVHSLKSHGMQSTESTRNIDRGCGTFIRPCWLVVDGKYSIDPFPAHGIGTSPSSTPPVVSNPSSLLTLFATNFAMRFSTIFTVLATGSVAFTAAVPQIVAKRDAMGIQTTLGDLGNQLGNIAPVLTGFKGDECAENAFEPMVSAIENQTSNLSGVSCDSDNDAVVSSHQSRQCKFWVVSGASSTSLTHRYQAVVFPLESHKNECDPNGCPKSDQKCSDVDPSLSELLIKTFQLCPATRSSISAA